MQDLRKETLGLHVEVMKSRRKPSVRLYTPSGSVKRSNKPRSVSKKSRASKTILKTKWRKSNLKDADSTFSKKILKRDGKCMYPGCTKVTNLTCSHYFGRANKATRFYENNCIALCLTHHFMNKMLGFEFQKQRVEIHGWDGQYTLFMKNWLGGEGWYELIDQSNIHLNPKEIKEIILANI